MALTFEEISQGIAETPELKDTILTHFETELPEYLKGKGFVVRSADDDEKEFGNRLRNKTSDMYNGIEKDVLESFGKYGIKKDSNTEKVYDMIKKVPSIIDAKIADLETKLADALAGKGDDVTKAQIEAYKKQVEQLEAEKTSLTEGYSQKELGYKVSRDLDKAFAEMQIVVPANVADKDKGDYISSKINLLTQALNSRFTAKEEDGKLVFTDADGNVQMNGTNPAAAKDLLSANFKYDFEPVKLAGSGSKGGNQTAPIVVQSKEQLYEAVAKEGLTLGSPEWTTRTNELAKTNGIDIAA